MTNWWTRVRSSINALVVGAVLLTTYSTAWSQEQIAPEPPARRWLPGQWAESVAAGVAAAKAAGGRAFNPAAGAMPAPKAAAMGTAPAQTASEIVLHSFASSPPKGAYPRAGLVRDSAGNFYGTTVNGGTVNQGVVYKMDPAGTETVLHTFGVAYPDGYYLLSGVVRDSAGNLYGTTCCGGTSGQGVVYKLDAARDETVLYTFTGGADRGHPPAGVILDAAGNLYGTAGGGGTSGAGVVFKVSTTGQETVLYAFTGGADGGYSDAGVIRDSAGNLYGTTDGGGTSGAGVVFKLSTSGQETVLYSFTGATDGSFPFAGVVRDSAGNLYGTASSGGTAGAGVVYEVNAAAQETVLYSFCALAGCADGGYAYAGVVRDSAGNLYGTASTGGKGNTGVVFAVKPQ